jgi:hypothetical protein
MNQIPITIKIIATLGLLPFFLGAIATFKISILDFDTKVLLIKLSTLYAGLILSFLGGCLFGFESISGKNPNTRRLWLSIIPSIWSLVALQIPHFSASILALGFLVVFEFDRKSSLAGTVPGWWLSLRLPLTAIVILNLTIIGFNHAS